MMYGLGTIVLRILFPLDSRFWDGERATDTRRGRRVWKSSRQRHISLPKFGRSSPLRASFNTLFVLAILLSLIAFAGCGSGSGNDAVTTPPKNPVTPAPTLSLSASSNSILSGQAVTLSWQTTDATSLTITATGTDGSTRAIPTNSQMNGSTQDKPTVTTTYAATASGPGGSAQQQAKVTVETEAEPQITQLSASPMTVVAGASTTLSWQTTDATSVTFTPELPLEDPSEAGSLPASNPAGLQIAVPNTVTYTMVANGPGGRSQPASVTITAVKINLTASPATTMPNQPVTLTWDVDPSITALAIDHGGCAPCTPLPHGSTTVTPNETTIYTATATLADGTQLKQTATATVTSAASGKIKHIFFMVQENRSFDNYFGSLGAYRAQRLQQFGIQASPSDVDGFDPNVVLTNHHDGVEVKPFHEQTVCTQNPTPSWDESHHNVGLTGGDPAWQTTSEYTAASFAMNNFLDTANGGLEPNETNYDPDGTRVMGYYNQTDLPYYYDLATFFATSDRWFSPELSATYPNRMYLESASSFGHEYPDADASHPQYSAKTIFRDMNEANVSWLYYYQDGMFLPNFQDYNIPAIQSKTYKTSYLMDLLAGTCSGAPCDPDKALPQVIFIESASGISALDEHPDNNIQQGAAYVQSIVSALMKSDAWHDSVFILTYDEDGGLYDHVPPIMVPVPDAYSQGQCPDPNNGSYGYCIVGPNAAAFTAPTPDNGGYDMFNLTGLRVPVMVISPYVKPHYISHTPMDYTAILAFIEQTFNVPPLTNRDAYWLGKGGMSDFFDFSTPGDLSPPGSSGGGSAWVTFLPAQPTNGTCDKTKEVGGIVN